MDLDLALLERVARGGDAAALGEREREQIAAARAVVEGAIADGRTVYGVTTGFGQLSDVRIPPDDAAQLQLNLLRSHADIRTRPAVCPGCAPARRRPEQRAGHQDRDPD